jgi:hypothetical protein
MRAASGRDLLYALNQFNGRSPASARCSVPRDLECRSGPWGAPFAQSDVASVGSSIPPGPVAFGLLSLPRVIADFVSPPWFALVPSADPETGGGVASEALGGVVCADAETMHINKPATANMGRYKFIFCSNLINPCHQPRSCKVVPGRV